jgi:glycosyltransferase involved in cell wall biosynthesis
MNILFLTPDFLLPADHGGRIRTLAQLRVLSSLEAVERISLFFLCEDDVTSDDREVLARQVDKLDIFDPVFHPVHLAKYPRYVPHVVWVRAVHGIPYLAAKWDSREVRRRLVRDIGGRDFDVVWFNGLGITRYLDLVRRLQPRARLVLDQHNVESDRFLQFAQRQHGIRRLIAAAEWRAARRYERDVMRAVDAVGAISEDDARAYRALAGVDARTVPQLVSFEPRTEPGASGPRLCWIGNLTWEPNARGLDWFCREVWPLVRARLPDATLEIAGSGLRTDEHGNAIAPAAWRVPGVTTLGFVEDLTPVYQRSAAMIAPILGGAGIRIKLIEAFAHGIPVVTTPDGAAGLPIQPGRDAFVESAPELFALRAVELVTSGALRAGFRDAGYAFLARHNGVAVAEAAVSSLLGSPSPGSGTPSRAAIADRYSASKLRTEVAQP